MHMQVRFSKLLTDPIYKAVINKLSDKNTITLVKLAGLAWPDPLGSSTLSGQQNLAKAPLLCQQGLTQLCQQGGRMLAQPLVL
jgi:hypothetical protein